MHYADDEYTGGGIYTLLPLGVLITEIIKKGKKTDRSLGRAVPCILGVCDVLGKYHIVVLRWTGRRLQKVIRTRLIAENSIKSCVIVVYSTYSFFFYS